MKLFGTISVDFNGTHHLLIIYRILHSLNTLISSTNNVYSMLPDSQTSLKVHHQNICSLKYKTIELLSFLYPHYPHNICLTEHHLNQLELDIRSIDNYNLGANYCRKSSLKGGICI
jgi:hypothetical protein